MRSTRLLDALMPTEPGRNTCGRSDANMTCSERQRQVLTCQPPRTWQVQRLQQELSRARAAVTAKENARSNDLYQLHLFSSKLDSERRHQQVVLDAKSPRVTKNSPRALQSVSCSLSAELACNAIQSSDISAPPPMPPPSPPMSGSPCSPPQYLADDLRQFSLNLQLDHEALLPPWTSTPGAPTLPSLTPVDAAWHLKAQSLAGSPRIAAHHDLRTSTSTSALGIGRAWHSPHLEPSVSGPHRAVEPGTLRLARISASASLGNLTNGTNGRTGSLGRSWKR